MEALHSIWLFIQDQVLGMKWLNAVIGNGLSAVGLDTSTRWGGSIQFFLYGLPCDLVHFFYGFRPP